MDEKRQHTEKAFDRFCESYRDRYPKAVECLEKARDALMGFYDVPAAHWKHTRAIESVFATVRQHTDQTKGMGTRTATLAMAFKRVKEAEKTWRKIAKWQQLELVREGRQFKDGELVEESAA